MSSVREPLSGTRRWLYGLGSAGWQLSDRIVVSIAVYFYLPPPGRGLENQVSTDPFLGVLTVFGVAMLVGRVFDSVADPLVGHWSDTSRSRLGRRRAFLLYGLLPMVALPVLLFWPPGPPGSALNAWWLTGLLAAYFVAFTVYVAPYLALLPEVAWTEDERVRLSRLLALVGFPIGAGFGTMWTLGYADALEAGLAPADAIRLVVVVAAAVSLVLCALPILAVDEARFARSRPSELPFRRAFFLTVGNRAFRIYLLAQLAMVFGITMIQPALPYFATVLLGRDEAFAAYLGGVTFAGIVVSLPLATGLVGRFGARRVMAASIALFGAACLGYGAIGLVATTGGGSDAATRLAFAASALIGPGVAGLLVVPNVLLSQLIDRDETATGANRSAMYFGVQGFLTKWMYGVSLWALSFLLARFGNSPEEPLGVVLVGPVAGAACVAAAVLFLRYPEVEVLAARPAEDA